MNMNGVAFASLLLAFLSGCTLPQIVQPLRLYDLKDGTTIEVVVHPVSRDHGTFSARNNQTGQFHGEYVFSSERVPSWGGQYPGFSQGYKSATGQTPPEDLADAYGYGKNSQARPVGTGIVVSGDGTVIELVFYRLSVDAQTGDGVGRDNKGRYYRIFLSTEE